MKTSPPTVGVLGPTDWCKLAITLTQKDCVTGPPKRLSNQDLELVSVTKRHGATVAVDAMNFPLKSDSYTCRLGPSGCGKSSTLRMIAGHESVSDGSFGLAGRDISHLPAAQRGTAMMFQNDALFAHLRFFDNVAFSLKMKGVDTATRHREAREMLAPVDLIAQADRLPDPLSGGHYVIGFGANFRNRGWVCIGPPPISGHN